MGIMNAPMMLAASSGDDVDFMVHGLIPLKFFGHKVWITTTHVTTLIVMVFIIVLALIARHAVLHGDEKPSGLQNFVEMIVEMLDNLVKGSMGRHWRPFVNYIGTIMVFIFFANFNKRIFCAGFQLVRIGFQVDAVQPLGNIVFLLRCKIIAFALKPCKNAVFDLLLIFSAVAEQIFQQLRHRFAYGNRFHSGRGV